MTLIQNRRMWVLAAIILMVASGLVSHFLVQSNDRSVNALKQQKQQADETIRGLWESELQAERNADAAVVVSLVASNNPGEAADLRHFYLSRIGQGAEAERSLLDVLRRVDGERQRTVDRINDTYLSTASLESGIGALEQKNETYAHIAFFMQLMSLVLILLTREIPHG